MLGGRGGEGMVGGIVLLFEYRALGRIWWCRSITARNGSAVTNDVFDAYIHAVRNADMRASIWVSTYSPIWECICLHNEL